MRKLFRSVFPDRPSRVLGLLLAGVALICTQIPLFNYLGFEFSALSALLASYASGLYVILTARPQKKKPAMSVLTLYRRTILPSLFFLLAPLLLLTLNAFLVRNCSFAQGFMFYLLLPVPAVFFSNAVAVLIVSLTVQWRKLLFTVTYCGILFHVVIVTMFGPQIFAFNPILGFFPGITYDETLEIGTRLGLYRLITLLMAALLVLTAVLRERRTQRKSIPSAGWITSSVGYVLLLALWLFSDQLGFSSSERRIRSELGGEIVTEHFVISYPAGSVSPAEAAQLADLHEFYFSRICQELDEYPEGKISSFVYADRAQKGRLIGAAGTNIAKPWLRQLHINLEHVPSVLKHEMVHVVAAEFGFPFLRIGANSGLIEGLAVAVERVEYDETVHRLAGQILALGGSPDMERLFSLTGFFRGHGGTSYVLAGSFCRFLIDRYGIRRFRWLYRTGSFQSFYNKDLETLVAEWERFVREVSPSRHELIKAAYLFRRPSIFGKECARVIAALNDETRRMLKERQWDEAVESSRRSMNLTGSPEAVTLHVTALFRKGDFQAFIDTVTAQLHDSTRAHTLLPLLLPLGDSYWAQGRSSEAREQYERLYRSHLSAGWDEAAGLRLEAIRRGERDLVEFFTSEMDESTRVRWLEARQTGNALVRYLLGRELMATRRYEEALGMFRSIRPFNSGVLEFARYRRIARSHFELADYQNAKMFFWESLNFTSKESHRIETEEWLDRCEWMEEKQ